MTALTYAVINGGDRAGPSPATLFGLGAAVLAGLAFVLVERRRTEPIVPQGLFGTRSFVGVLVAAFCYYFASYGELPVLSRWLRDGVRLASLDTSLLLNVQLVLFIAVPGLVSGRPAARPVSGTVYAGHPADPAAGVLGTYLFSGVLAVLGGALACWLPRPAASAARTTPAAAEPPG